MMQKASLCLGCVDIRVQGHGHRLCDHRLLLIRRDNRLATPKALLLLEKLLAVDPKDRYTASDALFDDYFWDSENATTEELNNLFRKDGPPV
jgi:serine/threonine protein kinase